jgi:cytidine deaminase
MKCLILLTVFLGVWTQSQSAEIPALKANDQACDYCIQALSQIINNATLQQLLHKVESYCSYLPGDFGTQCKQAVDQYGQQIINEILHKYSPKAICTDVLHLCSSKLTEQLVADAKQTSPCDMCKQLFGQVLNKDTLEQVLHRIDGLCDKLPGGFADQCRQIIDSYGEQVIQQILSKYTPESICRNMVHVCSYDQQKPVTAFDGGMLMRFYLDKAANDQLCDTCISVCGQILNEQTLGSILQKVEQLCNKLPSWASDQCRQLIDNEGKQIVSQILSQYTPDKICKNVIHVCQKK